MKAEGGLCLEGTTGGGGCMNLVKRTNQRDNIRKMVTDDLAYKSSKRKSTLKDGAEIQEYRQRYLARDDCKRDIAYCKRPQNGHKRR